MGWAWRRDLRRWCLVAGSPLLDTTTHQRWVRGAGTSRCWTCTAQRTKHVSCKIGVHQPRRTAVLCFSPKACCIAETANGLLHHGARVVMATDPPCRLGLLAPAQALETPPHQVTAGTTSAYSFNLLRVLFSGWCRISVCVCDLGMFCTYLCVAVWFVCLSVCLIVCSCLLPVNGR